LRLFVPGRVCLLGEHSDWAGGFRRKNPALEKGHTIVCGTNQGIYAEVEPHPSHIVMTSVTPSGELLGPREIPMQADALLQEAQKGGFWSYIAGVAYQVMSHNQVGGLTIHNYHTDLPIKKGLSSSAAISVLTARAFNLIYELKMGVRDEMELAYRGETTTPSRCGRMDQCCAFGSLPVLMTFDDDHLDTSELIVGADLHLVIVDLQAQKNTMKILESLNSCFPYAQNRLHEGVQLLLGCINKTVVMQAVQAIESGNVSRLGALMVESQTNFDRYAMPACPEELTSPSLHHVLSYAPLQPYIYGGKGLGSQGDGSAQFLARSESDQNAIVEILGKELGLPAITLTIKKN
jgi:galactokinase